MLVTLISPPQVFSKSQVTAGVVPPLGLLYLATYLKNQHIKVKMIDAVGNKFSQYTHYENITLRGMTFQEIIREIPEDSDLIGVSALYSSAHLITKELVRLIKLNFPQKIIVLGGAHATILTEFVLQDTDADIIVIGEGELTFLDLCQNLTNYEGVQGIAYKNANGVHFNESRELISDLDSLPIPDRGLINMQNYFSAAEPHGCSASGRWTTLLSSRGCPFNCTFCTTPRIWQRRWRCKSPERVIAEMTELYERYGVTDFHFEDENMGFNRKWMHSFCDLLLKSNLNITWQPSNGLRVETVLDPGLLEKMKRSGCSLVVFTLESASKRVRNDIIRKSLDISKVEKAVNLCNKAGIKSTCYFIIGLPGERLDEAKETIKFASYLARKGLDEPVISVFSMLPGSRLFNDFYEQGKLKLNPEFFRDLLVQGDLTSLMSWSEDISQMQLRNLRRHGYISFAINKTIFHPLKALRSIGNILRESDELKSERVVRTFIKRLVHSGPKH
jgi:magnesium-protoporphyrin IX monomethyl ester (oxidative) cyclase